MEYISLLECQNKAKRFQRKTIKVLLLDFIIGFQSDIADEIIKEVVGEINNLVWHRNDEGVTEIDNGVWYIKKDDIINHLTK